MPRSLDDTRRWMQDGTKFLLDAARTITSEDWTAPSGLPGWTRKHLAAHVAANANAIGNLVHWAATGRETPMYSSPDARLAGIARGPTLTSDELLDWLSTSADDLEASMSALSLEQWQHQVVTAQSRTVATTETPWMRAREVYVHAVDLGTGITFADLPEDYLLALQEDVTTKRASVGERIPELRGPLADITAYLTGRPYSDVTLTNGKPASTLGPWL